MTYLSTFSVASMTRRTILVAALAAGLSAVAAWVFLTPSGHYVQFVIGGGLVNLGYRMQDHLTSYDFEHEHVTPEEVWQEMLSQNQLAAAVRTQFPRSARHPLAALVVCMDARIDTNELTGDTRRFYYIIRTAGSVLSDKEQEMLELAVENGVKLIVLTTHSDCAAEAIAASPDGRLRFPALTQAVTQREEHIRELVARPGIKRRLAAGTLAVKLVDIDTLTERMLAVSQKAETSEQN
jgi:carbonic anhydrase